MHGNNIDQFFGGSELENGFKKSKHFSTYWLKAFSSDTLQCIERQNKGPKEHDDKYITSCGSKLANQKNASTRPIKLVNQCRVPKEKLPLESKRENELLLFTQ